MISLGQVIKRTRGKLDKKSHHSKKFDFECTIGDYYHSKTLKKICLNYLKENKINYKIDFEQRLYSKKYYYFSVNVADKDFDSLYQHMHNFIYGMKYISAFNNGSRLYIEKDTVGKYSNKMEVGYFIFVYDVEFVNNIFCPFKFRNDSKHRYTARNENYRKCLQDNIDLDWIFEETEFNIVVNPITKSFMYLFELQNWYNENNPRLIITSNDGYKISYKRFLDLDQCELEQFKELKPSDYERLSQVKW